MAGATVAVTGANGFISAWLIKLLLERGYNVRGTVRDPGDVTKVGHLLKLPGAKERLVLFKMDLLKDGDFDRVFDGVEGVFHTASPVPPNTPEDIQRDLLDPALKGTINVLESAAKATSVKRVVLTSSTVAISASEAGSSAQDLNIIIDETWWSDPEWCKNNKWYSLSKTQAERAAWDFAKEKGLDLVVMNPAAVVGPMLQSKVNASSQIIFDYLNGSKKEIPNHVTGFVHVKDVALAHLIGFENAAAQGRYLLVEKRIHGVHLAELLRVLCPQCPITDKYPHKEMHAGATFSTEKIRKLGLVFTPAEEGIRECVESLKEKKLLSC